MLAWEKRATTTTIFKQNFDDFICFPFCYCKVRLFVSITNKEYFLWAFRQIGAFDSYNKYADFILVHKSF